MGSPGRFIFSLAKICGFVATLLPIHAIAQTQSTQETGTSGFSINNALDIGDCPATAKDLPTDKVFLCTCPGFIVAEWEGGRPGPVWGTLIYSRESFICNAAIHAGVAKKGKVGRVFINFVQSPPVLRGTTQNGIKSSIVPRAVQDPFQLAPAP